MFAAVVAALLARALAAAPGPEGPPLEWRPVLEVRPRFRMSTAEGEGTATPAAALRARVGMQVTRGILSARVSIQDVHGWNDGGSISYGRMPMLAEGWANIDASPSDSLGFALKVGRQAIQLEDGRLVGARDWAMKGQFLDGARVEFVGAPVTVEVMNVRRSSGRSDEPFGAGVSALRVSIGRTDRISLWQVDGVALVDARLAATPVTTAGMFTKVESGRFRGRLEAYGQADAAGNAGLLNARLGWVFGPEERVVLYGEGGVESGGFYALSQDTTVVRGGGGMHAWRPILGDGREYHGLLGLPGESWDGDGSAMITLDCGLAPRLRIDTALRQDFAATSGSPLATTLETDVRWYVSPFAAFSLGGAGRVGETGRGWSAAGYGAVDVEF